MKKKAVILLSGGLDSTTVLAIAKRDGFDPYALTVVYGQRHLSEINAAKRVAQKFGATEHKIATVSLGDFGGSALTDRGIDIPDYQDSDEIPVTYVPARNTIFLALALGWAEVIGAYAIFIGANDVDYSGYPDCRPAFLEAFEKTANLATKAGVNGESFKIHAPLLRLTKADIIQQGMILGIDYSETVSCYQADIEGRACGRCDSCALRRKGFSDSSISDPTRYVDM